MEGRIPVEIKGLCKAVFTAAVLCIIIAVVVYYTGLKETLIHPLARLTLIISVLTGACQVTRVRGNKGLVRGISMGIMFFTLMIIATLLFNPNLIEWKSFLTALGICVLSGGIGGILGIGLRD